MFNFPGKNNSSKRLTFLIEIHDNAQSQKEEKRRRIKIEEKKRTD